MKGTTTTDNESKAGKRKPREKKESNISPLNPDSFINLLPDALIILNSGYEILEINDLLVKLTGFSRKELLNTNIFLGNLFNDNPEFESLIKNLSRRKKAGFKTGLKIKNGRSISAEIKAAYSNDDDGKIYLFIRQIAEPDDTQNSLCENENNAESDERNCQSLDETGNFISVNNSWLNMLGYTKEEVSGRWFGDFILPELLPLFIGRFQKFKEKGSIKTEFVMIRKDGTQILVELDGKIIKNPDGSFKQTKSFLRDISQQKIQNSIVEQSFFPKLSPEPSFRVNRKGMVLYPNPVSELLGFTNGCNISDFIYDIQIADVFDNALNGNKVELFQTLKDRFYRFTFRGIPGLKEVFVYGTDITELKHAEEEAYISKSTLTAIFESSPFIIMLVDKDGNIRHINKVGIEISGKEKSEILDHLAGEVLHCINSFSEEGCGKSKNCANCLIRSNLNKTYRTGQPVLNREGTLTITFEKRILEMDLLISTNRVKHKDEDLVLLTIVDITESKRAEKALAASEKKFREFADNVDAAFWIRSIRNNEIVYLNKGFEKIWGVKQEVLMENANAFLNFIHPDDKQKIEATLNNELENPEIPTNEMHRIIKPDGEIRWLWRRTFPIYNEDKTVINRAGIASDITRQKRMDEVLQAKTQLNNLQDEMSVKDILIFISEKSRQIIGAESVYLVFIERNRRNTEFRLWIKGNEDSSSGETVEVGNKNYSSWEKCLSSGSAVITNKFEDSEYRINYKNEEIEIGSEVIVPITENYKIKALFGAVSKKTLFEEYDAELLGIISENILRILNRKKIEEELRSSEARYRSLFEKNSAVIIIIEPESGMIADVNNAACKYYGYSREELLNMQFSRINIHPKGNLLDEMFKLIDLKKNNFIFRHRLSNGEERDVEVFAGELSLNNKKYIYSIVHDITNRRVAERELSKYRNQLEELVKKRTEELYRSEERFRKLSETSRDLILRINSNNRILYTNPIFSELTSIIPEKLFLHKIEELPFPDEFIQFIIKSTEKVINSGFMERAEFEYPEGTWIDWLIMPEYSEKNIIDSVIGFGRDITERRNLELSIKESLEREKDLNELKTNFISMASHEFRTPLTAILSSADLLEMFGRKWDERKYLEHITKIQTSVYEMTSLINDVLIISSSDFRRLNANLKDVNLLAMCNEVIATVRRDELFNHDLQLKYNCSDTIFFLDEKLIKQLLINLLSNSVKYTPALKKVSLTIEQNMENELVIISEDEGLGIDEIDQKRIFEPFYRGENIGDKPGTGLGLAIVKKAVDSHKGNLELLSVKNKGTRFVIKLPVTKTIDSGK